jgi:hypothetical protein
MFTCLGGVNPSSTVDDYNQDGDQYDYVSPKLLPLNPHFSTAILNEAYTLNI